MAALPSFTTRFHRDAYPDIWPTRPALSAAGKVVIITGAAGQIGKATCKAFARAGAQHVVMLDLDLGGLQAAKLEIEAETADSITTIVMFAVDITDEAAIEHIFCRIELICGKMSVLISNAGYQSSPQRFRDASVEEWWKGFEVNAKGSFIVSREFIRRAVPKAVPYPSNSAPVLVNVASILGHWGSRQGHTDGQSPYAGAKIAMARAMEALQEEEPGLRVVNLHPGLVATPMAAKAGTLKYSIDNGEYLLSFI